MLSKYFFQKMCHVRTSMISLHSSSHVKRMVNIVQKHRPGIRVLIWDDVIRGEQFIGKENLVSA